MIKSAFDGHFRKAYSKIKDKALKDKIAKQFEKIRDNPEVGKPMKNTRKGTREVYVSPYRLSYTYIKEGDKVIFLDLYHKNEQ